MGLSEEMKGTPEGERLASDGKKLLSLAKAQRPEKGFVSTKLEELSTREEATELRDFIDKLGEKYNDETQGLSWISLSHSEGLY